MALLCGTMAIAQKRSCCVPWRRYLRALAEQTHPPGRGKVHVCLPRLVAMSRSALFYRACTIPGLL